MRACRTTSDFGALRDASHEHPTNSTTATMAESDDASSFELAVPKHPARVLSNAKKAKQSVSDLDLIEEAVLFLHHKASFELNCLHPKRDGRKYDCKCWMNFDPIEEEGEEASKEEASSLYAIVAVVVFMGSITARCTKIANCAGSH